MSGPVLLRCTALDLLYLAYDPSCWAKLVRRREFISLLGGAATVWPLAARAQMDDRMRCIGVLSALAEDDPFNQVQLAAFHQTCAKFGWIEGRNLRIDIRFAAGSASRFGPLAKELVALQPDVILAQSTEATAAFQQETRTIPIVFTAVSDPIGS